VPATDEEQQHGQHRRDFCKVADTGLLATLPLWLSAGPKQNSDRRAMIHDATVCS
jgi:hypothetical protein